MMWPTDEYESLVDQMELKKKKKDKVSAFVTLKAVQVLKIQMKLREKFDK